MWPRATLSCTNGNSLRASQNPVTAPDSPRIRILLFRLNFVEIFKKNRRIWFDNPFKLSICQIHRGGRWATTQKKMLQKKQEKELKLNKV